MRRSDTKPGFTLPAVLVVVAALLILAVGILLVTGVERDTARSFVDRQRAEIAARAGLEEFRGILAKEAGNDDYIILQSTVAKPIIPGVQPAPHLFLARAVPDVAPDPAEKKFTYRYIPLFSALTRPPEAPFNEPKIDKTLTGENLPGQAEQYLDFLTLPYHDKVRAAWLPVQDENGRVVARYAYWVEDLQSRVDPAIAGNDKDKDEDENNPHVRIKWPFPAPGLNNLSDIEQIATYALDPEATDADQKTLGKTLFKNRPLLLTPDSQLAAAGLTPPLTRLETEDTATGGKIGDLIDLKARAVERGIATNHQTYDEQPLVPHAAGIDPSAAGKPKLNLNKLLATGGDAAVTEMAAFINEALPDFDDRKGGFPDDYVKTLAANAIDYADDDKTDENKNPTVKDGEYRGIDAYPLVSEYLFKLSWEKKRTEGGRIYVDLSCTVYAEFWNMTNVPVDGDAEVTYETKYEVQIPPNPNPFKLGDLTNAVSPNLTDSLGYKWFPKFKVELKPNEYRVIKCGTVNYSFDMGPEGTAVPNLMPFNGEISGPSASGYRMRWNNKLVDQSRGGLRRSQSVTLSFSSVTANPQENTNSNGRRVYCNIPGHTYVGATGQNMGDARMAFYIQASQNNNAYPQNYSPNRRNIRLDIYTPANNRAIGRVLPSEWPDGGHDSPFGTDTIYGLLPGMLESDFVGNYLIEPDDPRFYDQLPYEPPKPFLGKEEAPTRLSNSGRFYSVTELGRVYDPIMWQTNASTDPSIGPGSAWGDVSKNDSSSSANHGGGNTLRIGRPEHQKFDPLDPLNPPVKPGLRASHLLDLFHTGISLSATAAQREGALVKINGHVNINTASKPALRQLIAGSLGQDPEMRSFISGPHKGGKDKLPDFNKLNPIPDATAIVDSIVNSINAARPFASTGELAKASEFGKKSLFTDYPSIQWTDSAAEEVFARTFDASTVRSRNFRIWVVGQSLAPSASVSASPKVLAEIRKNFTVFADPGERKTDNTPDPAKFRLKILHESDF